MLKEALPSEQVDWHRVDVCVPSNFLAEEKSANRELVIYVLRVEYRQVLLPYPLIVCKLGNSILIATRLGTSRIEAVTRAWKRQVKENVH
jgi:hypothetical protein